MILTAKQAADFLHLHIETVKSRAAAGDMNLNAKPRTRIGYGD